MSERRHLLTPFGLPPLHDPENLSDSRPGLMVGDHIHLTCVASFTPLLAEPAYEARALSTILFGEPLQLLEDRGAWCRVLSHIDHYTGWVVSDAVAPYGGVPTHRVAVPLSHRYSEPDLKSAPAALLPMGSFVRMVAPAENGFLPMEEGGWLYAKHLVAVGSEKADPVDQAEAFIGAPYLWGGRSAFGIDCSGLVQLALARAGYRVHRDSGPQLATLGRPLEAGESPARGDLAFFPGHVGWMIDAVHLLHANATHMAVTIDPVEDVTGWVAAQMGDRPGKPAFLGFRRLAD
ncbi:MAG: hypothetical protein EP335_15645 [Alphaproteobacteria bacterium]|nr:MAG: hypothetical protein EP335_15645 [Alphaproteobacteria bacterium]